ncbi:MAG: CPBP family intramembrane metalloprotease [Peptococcaceae bacterium]|nr:CPBP family intramembrane metalloprotease [Peptococcaceae bacterium]
MSNFRFQALLAIFKKEILDIFRDKRTLAIMILLPLILYPVILVVASQFSIMMMQSREEKVLDVAFAFPLEPRLETLLKEQESIYKLNLRDPGDPAQALAQKEILSYVTLEKTDGRDSFKIYYNSSDGDSRTASDRISMVLEDYKRLLTEDLLLKAGLAAESVLEPIAYQEIDTAGDNEKTGFFLGTILPFLMIIALVTGAMYPAIDVTSGEKERGTLETLLTLPLSGLELMGGKFLAVALVAVISALINFFSLVLVGIFLLRSLAVQAGGGQIPLQLDLGTLILPFGLILICILIFALFVSALILCITCFARSFKEANNYLTPVMILFMLPAMATMIPGITLNTKTAAIPIVNICLLIRDALALNYSAVNMAIVLLSNLVYTIMAVLILSKIYNSENILFGTGGELNLLESRRNIITGSKISCGDCLLVYFAGLVLLFYISPLFTRKFGFYGIALTQAVILILPLLAAVYLKADFKQTFWLKLPAIRDIVGGLLLWAGAFILANLSASLLLYLFPQNEEVVEQLGLVLKGDSLWATLLVVALLPAICEELFFRGFIFSSLQGSVKTIPAIGITGLLFAFYHLDFIRLAPTFILGVLFTLALYRSGSILVPMIMHFANNALASISLFYPAMLEKINSIPAFTGHNVLWPAIFLLLAALLIFVGNRLLTVQKAMSTDGNK